MWRYLLLWIPMLVIAFINGAVREAWLRKHFDEHQSHQVSTVLLVLLFALYIGFVIRTWPPASAGRALAIGLMWLGLTLAFEFLFGHYVSGLSWSALLRDYDLFSGRLWALVPLWVLVAPWVFYRLRRG